MALNIKDPKTLELIAEVAALAGETKTEAVRTALAERRERLAVDTDADARYQEALRFMREEIWSLIPEAERGRPITKAEREEILGYGPHGV